MHSTYRGQGLVDGIAEAEAFAAIVAVTSAAPNACPELVALNPMGQTP